MTLYVRFIRNTTLASGRIRYTPDAGFKTAGVQVSSVYFLPNNWNIQAQLKYERLLRDVADSPVVKDENQYTLALGFPYSFSASWRLM